MPPFEKPKSAFEILKEAKERALKQEQAKKSEKEKAASSFSVQNVVGKGEIRNAKRKESPSPRIISGKDAAAGRDDAPEVRYDPVTKEHIRISGQDQ